MHPASPDAYTNISRRAPDIEDYVDMLRRHKAWIFGPAFAATVLAVVGAFLWPDTFVSTAVLRVVPPLVPENYVATNVNSQMSQRISSMYQTISSRNSLANIITTLNLYPKERETKPVADIVEQMRKAIKIGDVVPVSTAARTRPGAGVSAFSVSFSYENRFVAQKVTNELVSRFLSENQRERTTQSIQTTQFLRDQLDSAKKKLDAIEDKVAAFRTSFAGRLPEQVQGNNMQLNALEARITNINSQINRASQDRMLLESDMRTFKSQKASLMPAPEQMAALQKNDDLVALDRKIAIAETQLEALRQNYTENYPDVRRLTAEYKSFLKQREKVLAQAAEASSQPQTAAAKKYDPAFEREMQRIDASIDRLAVQIKTKEAEIQQYVKEINATEGQIKVVRSRLDSAPISEQQYAEIIRDRDTARLEYAEFNRKQSSSAVAEELEKRNQGETLELLDQASLPLTTQTKRPLIIGAGAAAGLVLGILLAGAREAKDTCLKNLKDVRAYTQLTILGSVPLLENDLVVRRRKRVAWLAWSTACLLGVGVMASSVFYYYSASA